MRISEAQRGQSGVESTTDEFIGPITATARQNKASFP